MIFMKNMVCKISMHTNGKKGSMVSIHAGMTAGVAFDFTWTALKGRI